MTLTVVPNKDLQTATSRLAGPNAWQSSGDDPAFTLAFSAFRQPFLVIHIGNARQPVDPRLYINRGQGFREKDAFSLKSGSDFVIIADVGLFGTICSMRVDPASFAVDFDFAVQCFSSRRAALACAAELQARKTDTQLLNLGRLPRFWMKVPQLHRKPSLLTTVKRYSEASYRLAASLPVSGAPLGPDPWLSIVVPVYNAPPRYLEDLVKSFESQEEPGCELILSDDGSTSQETLQWFKRRKPKASIKLQLNAKNGGIAVATNAGMQRAKGEWVALLDHDDVIAPHALKVIRRALLDRPEAQFLYTDELVVDDHLRTTAAMLKPAYDPVLLTGVNYINHFSIYRRDRLEQIGFLRTGYDGSQDYDLLLRYLEGLPPETILHLPYPAYWWRRTGHTYSRQFMDKATTNARKSLADRFSHDEGKIEIASALTETLHRVMFTPSDGVWPKISVIIPSKDNYACISRILRDLFEKTDYPEFEVLVIDNGTTEPAVLELYEQYRQKYLQFRAEIEIEPFNFSRSVNRGMGLATGEHLLVLNNDVEVIDSDWLKEMVSCLSYEKTGIVGAKLLYPNQTIQHAGVIIGFGGLAGHWYLNKPKEFGGPMNRFHVRNSVTCVTGAAMLISGECARAVGQWDEEHFAIAYNDVDYCLRAHKAGFQLIWTPFACLFHHESVSRGSDKVGDAKKRFDIEKQHLRDLHDTGDFRDRALNPHYGRTRSTPDIMVPTELLWPATVLSPAKDDIATHE